MSHTILITLIKTQITYRSWTKHKFNLNNTVSSPLVFIRQHITLLNFVRSVVYFDQLLGDRHTWISYPDNIKHLVTIQYTQIVKLI